MDNKIYGNDSARKTSYKEREIEMNKKAIRQIKISRSEFLDKIKIIYRDDTQMEIGLNSGVESPDQCILAPGEHIIRIMHEKIEHKTLLGGGIEFYTSYGREFKYWKEGKDKKVQKDIIQYDAKPGYFYSSFNVVKGTLCDFEEVQIEETINYGPGKFFAVCWYEKIAEKRSLRFNNLRRYSKSLSGIPGVRIFSSEKESEEYLQSLLSDSNENYTKQNEDIKTATPKKLGIVYIDVSKNKIIKKAGNKLAQDEALDVAVENGLWRLKNSNEISTLHMLKIMMKCLSNKTAIYNFCLTTLFLLISGYLQQIKTILNGHLLTSIASTEYKLADLDTTDPSKYVIEYMATFFETKENILLRSIICSYLLFTALYILFEQFNIWIHHNACEGNNLNLKENTMKHLLQLDQTFYDLNSMSSIRGKMRFDCISNQITWNVPYMIYFTARIIYALIYMFTVDYTLGISLICLTVIFYILSSTIRKNRSYVGDVDHKLRKNMDQVFDENLEMMSTIKQYSREEKHMSDLSIAKGGVIRHLKNIVFWRNADEFFNGMKNALSFCLVLYILLFYKATNLTGPQIVTVFLLYNDVEGIINRFNGHSNLFIDQFPYIEKYYELMEAKAVVIDGNLSPKHIRGDIEFRNVSFNYPTRPKDAVLKNFSLNIKSKCMTAFVGDSGAGKSTIANLLMRSYDPTEGDVFVDGHNMRNYNIKSLHSRMSIVSQSPSLFEDSILENIAYSKDNVTMDQIKKASATANCDEFVAKFRTGWNTMVGSRGLQLSGGQRQRLAIARAALADPDILILDEATSALDAKNETLVKEALDVLMTDKTVIVIAHRLSTIRNADTIVCMRDGGIEEIGTHDELIAKKGFYFKLVEKQLESSN